jgi:PAS domain S-box-containing protein
MAESAEELRREKEQLDGLFELSPDAVIVTDDDFRVLRVNEEFTRIFGYTAEEAVGHGLAELLVPEEFHADYLQHRASLALGERIEFEAIRQRKDGVRFDVSVVAKSISIGHDQIAVYLIYRDITERNAAKRKLERSEANLLESQRLVHMCSWAYEPSTGKITSSPEGYRIFEIKSNLDIWTIDLFFDRVHPEDRPALEERYRRELLDKTDYTLSYRIVLPDGSIKRIFTVGHPVLNESGELVELIGTSMDVTEQWKAAEALRRSEGYLAEAQRLSHTGSFGWNVPSGELFWSEETFNIFQYDRTTKPNVELFLQRVYPEDADRVRQTIERASQDGNNFEHEFRLLMPDGSVKYVHSVAYASRDKAGGLEFVGAVSDVTARKRAEEGLRKSEERWRSVFENSAIGVALTDLDGRFLATNHVYQTMVGYTEEELRALCFLDVTHEDYSEANWALVTELLEGKRRQFQIEKKYRRKDGSLIWVRNNVSLVPGTERVPRFIMALSEDITQRKRAEEALQRSEGYLAEAERLSHTGSWAWNVRTGSLFWSQEIFRIYDYPFQETGPGWPQFLERVHPEDRPQIERRAKIEASGKEWVDSQNDFRIVLPDGKIKHLHSVAYPVRDESGEITEVVGTVMDVTEQHQARAALQTAFEQIKAEETELRQMIDAVASYIYVLRPDGTALYANQTVLNYLGVTLEDVRREDHRARIFHPDDLERVREEREGALARGKPFETEQRALGKDGKYRWFLVRYIPLRDDQGNIIRWYATGTDIEDRKQAEERMRDENLALREQIDQAFMFEEIVGSSPALQNVLSSIVKVAPTDSTVLITGETGTGKELIARAIHKHSQRSGRAFISVNCASIPSSLVASELFGHEKGAFTGAVQRRQGRFELAHSGTIFLDEIGELPAETQVALLRVLQERQFERVGGNQVLSADVRVIAATNRDLTAAIAAGTFRSDLFYRLNVFPIEMPPLRKRKEDIPTLIEYFVKRYAEKAGKQIRKIDRNTLELCQSYPWPGNIRELQNIVERSVILCGGDTFWIEKAWLESGQPTPEELASPLSKTLHNQEKEMIEAALAESKGKVAGPEGAAAKLGIPRSTLDSKIKQLGIKKHKFISE